MQNSGCREGNKPNALSVKALLSTQARGFQQLTHAYDRRQVRAQ